MQKKCCCLGLIKCRAAPLRNLSFPLGQVPLEIDDVGRTRLLYLSATRAATAQSYNVESQFIFGARNDILLLI